MNQECASLQDVLWGEYPTMDVSHVTLLLRELREREETDPRLCEVNVSV